MDERVEKAVSLFREQYFALLVLCSQLGVDYEQMLFKDQMEAAIDSLIRAAYMGQCMLEGSDPLLYRERF